MEAKYKQSVLRARSETTNTEMRIFLRLLPFLVIWFEREGLHNCLIHKAIQEVI